MSGIANLYKSIGVDTINEFDNNYSVVSQSLMGKSKIFHSHYSNIWLHHKGTVKK